jgi:starch phosphorylase
MTNPIKTLDVRPSIPPSLNALRELAYNIWFVWNYETDGLFRRMNPELWEEVRKNPVELLGRLKQQDLETLSHDEGFIAHLERVKQEFDRYMSEKPNPQIFGAERRSFQVAYFTAECGVAGCLPIYSGGLGILSGDHLKSSSDLNLPLFGVSLAYQKGYFRQYLSKDGWQMETYPINQFNAMPMQLVRGADGVPIKVAVDLKGETVQVRAWEVRIGRISLFLLDTNLEENSPGARDITSELYGGDREMRIRQEIILGIGGVRMIRAMGLDPAVYHMNEGHSAFATFERIRVMREDRGLTFNQALELIRVTNVFTTHTPVPAGIDTFHPDLMRAYFEGFARSMGISLDVLLGFGRQDPRNRGEEFSMAVLALRLSNWNNGVSKLHGRVSRKMWQNVWPKTPENDLPIICVTNGVHIPSWISQGMAENYDRYLGRRWIEDPDNVKVWERVNKIPDSDLWRTHERARERLVAFTRTRLKAQWAKRGVSNRDLALADEVLNSETLTIGFARRFAPYKRAYLLIKDIERLDAILTNQEHPVQIILSGKAHPQDQMGKDLIRQILQISNREQFRRHMVFLEDYDMEIARHMVQGVDVWLNTPRRPLEACGTSGMKAVANGALHMSVLDGWWDEGFDREVGWAIGSGEEYTDHDFQDELESKALYDVLEKDVVPLFYNRGSGRYPKGWVAMMKASMNKLCPIFNTHRMVEEYWDKFYLRAAQRAVELTRDEAVGLKNLAAWREKIMYNWANVSIQDIRMESKEEISMDAGYHVEADIFLGELDPADIMAEAYYGRLDPSNQYVDSFATPMTTTGPIRDRVFRYRCDIRFEEVGHYGLNIRLTPNHPNPESRHGMGLVIWGQK